MTSKERFDLYIKNVPDVPLCEYCKHFTPHYIAWFGDFKKLDRGHCVFPRIKNRDAYDTCQYFEKNEEATD